MLKVWAQRLGRCVVGAVPLAFGAVALAPGAALAGPPPWSCGGFALQGGAELLCSHTDPQAPPQICTYSWALSTMTGTLQVVDGSFLLVPGVSNATVYQGNGYAAQLSPPIVMCQGKLSR